MWLSKSFSNTLYKFRSRGWFQNNHNEKPISQSTYLLIRCTKKSQWVIFNDFPGSSSYFNDFLSLKSQVAKFFDFQVFHDSCKPFKMAKTRSPVLKDFAWRIQSKMLTFQVSFSVTTPIDLSKAHRVPTPNSASYGLLPYKQGSSSLPRAL